LNLLNCVPSIREQAFEDRESAVGPKRVVVSEEEMRREHLEDPEVKARVRAIRERMRRGEPPGPGITQEQLPDFLREHG
jgi:hypothetical protein